MTLDIIKYDPENFDFMDENCRPFPAFVTRGCGCCSSVVRVTRESIDEAIQQAKDWLAFLEGLQPVDYSRLEE